MLVVPVFEGILCWLNSMGQLHVGLYWVFSVHRGATATHIKWKLHLYLLFLMQKPFDLELVNVPSLDFSLLSI